MTMDNPLISLIVLTLSGILITLFSFLLEKIKKDKVEKLQNNLPTTEDKVKATKSKARLRSIIELSIYLILVLVFTFIYNIKLNFIDFSIRINTIIGIFYFLYNVIYTSYNIILLNIKVAESFVSNTAKILDMIKTLNENDKELLKRIEELEEETYKLISQNGELGKKLEQQKAKGNKLNL